MAAAKGGDHEFAKDVETIAALMKEADEMRRELERRRKTETHSATLKKLYLVREENRRLRAENARLRSQLSSGPTDTSQSQVVGKGREQLAEAVALKRENQALKQLLQGMREIVQFLPDSICVGGKGARMSEGEGNTAGCQGSRTAWRRTADEQAVLVVNYCCCTEYAIVLIY